MTTLTQIVFEVQTLQYYAGVNEEDMLAFCGELQYFNDAYENEGSTVGVVSMMLAGEVVNDTDWVIKQWDGRFYKVTNALKATMFS